MQKMSKFLSHEVFTILIFSLAPGTRANAFYSIGIDMARKEGVLSLMNGFTASMMREIVYSGIRLGSYEYFKDK